MFKNVKESWDQKNCHKAGDALCMYNEVQWLCQDHLGQERRKGRGNGPTKLKKTSKVIKPGWGNGCGDGERCKWSWKQRGEQRTRQVEELKRNNILQHMQKTLGWWGGIVGERWRPKATYRWVSWRFLKLKTKKNQILFCREPFKESNNETYFWKITPDAAWKVDWDRDDKTGNQIKVLIRHCWHGLCWWHWQ